MSVVYQVEKSGGIAYGPRLLKGAPTYDEIRTLFAKSLRGVPRDRVLYTLRNYPFTVLSKRWSYEVASDPDEEAVTDFGNGTEFVPAPRSRASSVSSDHSSTSSDESSSPAGPPPPARVVWIFDVDADRLVVESKRKLRIFQLKLLREKGHYHFVNDEASTLRSVGFLGLKVTHIPAAKFWDAGVGITPPEDRASILFRGKPLLTAIFDSFYASPETRMYDRNAYFYFGCISIARMNFTIGHLDKWGSGAQMHHVPQRTTYWSGFDVIRTGLATKANRSNWRLYDNLGRRLISPHGRWSCDWAKGIFDTDWKVVVFRQARVVFARSITQCVELLLRERASAWNAEQKPADKVDGHPYLLVTWKYISVCLLQGSDLKITRPQCFWRGKSSEVHPRAIEMLLATQKPPPVNTPFADMLRSVPVEVQEHILQSTGRGPLEAARLGYLYGAGLPMRSDSLQTASGRPTPSGRPPPPSRGDGNGLELFFKHIEVNDYELALRGILVDSWA